MTTREILLDEVLKRPDASRDAISYLSEPRLNELMDNLSQALAMVRSSNLLTETLAGFASVLFDLYNRDEIMGTYVYLLTLSDELCSEIAAVEVQKKDHWEKWEYVRLMYPEKAKDPKVRKAWDKEFYALEDEQHRLQAMRGRISMELNILNSAYAGLDNLVRLLEKGK